MNQSLPPQDDDLPAGQFTVPTPMPGAPVFVRRESKLSTPATVREDLIDDLMQDNDFIKRVLLRSDLTQLIARMGLFDHFKQKLLLAEPVPDRSVHRVGNDWVYMIVVNQRGSTSSAISLLVHHKKLQPAELNVMIVEASRITDEARVENRRKALAEQKTRIDSYTDLNRNTFPSDVEFFEAVMIDKYQFRKLLTQNAGAEIEPTAKV